MGDSSRMFGSVNQRSKMRGIDQLTATINSSAAAITREASDDPAPQITLLASWTGFDLAVLLLATALWPIALAELTGSVGFYLSASLSRRTERNQKRFWQFRANKASLGVKSDSTVVPSALSPSIHWGKLS